MTAEARPLFKIKSIKQKIPMKPPHGRGITRKVSQVSQAHATVKKAAPSRPHLPEIMSVRRILVQSYRYSFTIGAPIAKVKLINPVPVKVKRCLPKFGQPLRVEPRAYKHLSKIEPQKTGLKPNAKISPKVFIQQSELITTSCLPKMTPLKAPLSKVDLTPLPKVGGQSMPSPSLPLPKNRTMLSLKKFRELEEEIQPIIEEAPQGGGAGIGVSVNFFDLFLDCVKGEGGVKGAFESAGPMVLVLAKREDDDYARAIQSICRESYRERTNLGKPGIRVITEGNWRELEQLDPKHNVSLVEIDNHSLPANFLEEFARANEPGFLIFYVDQDKSEEFYDTVWSQVYPQRIRLYLLNLKKLSLETKKRIASLAWGLGENIDWISDIVDFGVKPSSFDHFFLNGEAKFWKYLESLGGMEEGLYSLATKRNEEGEEGGKESGLHYSLKLFLVRYHAKKRNLKDLEKIREEIRTEEDVPGGRVDLYLPAENIAIEVETLYGQGFSPLSAINEKVRNHVLEHAQRLHFVLSNLTFLRYFNGLKGIKRNLGGFSPLVEFYAVDIKGEALLSLSEVQSEMRQIAASIQKPSAKPVLPL